MREEISKYLGFIEAQEKQLAGLRQRVQIEEKFIERAYERLAALVAKNDLRRMTPEDIAPGTLFFGYAGASGHYCHRVTERVNDYAFVADDGCNYTLHYKFILK